MAGIQLYQPNGAGALNSAGAQHPAPVTIEVDMVCQLSFIGGTTARHRWVLTKPSGSAAVLSSTTSSGPSFMPDVDGGSYSVSLFDIDENEYILDIVTPTDGAPTGGGGGSVVTTIATYADVRAATFAPSEPQAVVLVQCRATVDDGGGGAFAFDSEDDATADNDGTVLVDADGNRLKRVYSGSIDVRWFGAVADVDGAADGVLSGGSVSNLASASTTFTADDVGKIVLIHTPKSAATGTVQTGTSFTEGEGYALTGSGTAFLTELFTGQRILIGATEYNVVSITSNTAATIYPLPPNTTAGQTLYRSVQHFATISAFVNATNVTISPGATVAGSSLRFLYGTDNLDAFNNAAAYAQSLRKEILIPGSASSYAISDTLDTITVPGFKVIGHGTSALSQSPFGGSDWLRSDLMWGSIVRCFSGSFLKVEDAINVYAGPVLEHFMVIGPGFGETTGLGRVSGNWSNAFIDDVSFCNFSIGVDIEMCFGSTWNNLTTLGCGIGVHAIASNTQRFDYLSAQGCAVGLDIEGLGNSTFNQPIMQGNVGQASLYMHPFDSDNACLELLFVGGYWENNPTGLLMGNFLKMHAATGTSISQITFEACHSGDVYTFEPTGDGTITTIKTVNNQFAGTVKPTWDYWTNGGSWSIVDLSNKSSVAMPLLSIGSSATPDGQQAFYHPATIDTGPSPDEVTPDLLDSFFQDVIYSNNVKINAPTFNGATPPKWWTITLFFRPQAGGTVVTWDAAFITNPWTDSGTASGRSAFISWMHIGSNTWVCFGYQPFVDADTLVRSGAGSPEGSVTAAVGTAYLRTDGATNTTLWTKVSGSGNTGWESVRTSYPALNVQRVARGVAFVVEADADIDGYGRVTINTTSGTSVMIPVEVPDGCTLTDILLRVIAGSNVDLPAVMPRFFLRKLVGNTNTESSSSAAVDASANVGAYNAQHTIVLNSIGETVDNTTNRYMIEFVSESGANAATGFKVITAEIYYTVTDPDRGAA